MPEDSNDSAYEVLDWEFIIDTIREEKCILILGPEIYLQDEVKLDAALSDYLQVPNLDILKHYQEDGFFLFASEQAKTRSIYKIRKFYKQHFPETKKLLTKLSKIPFHIYINTVPNELINEVFENQGFQQETNFYFKNQPSEDIDPPDKNVPLLYNLFGSIQHDESLVLSHDDLFDYFKSIFGAKSMPGLLKKELAQAHNFIFLGLQFDKWYVQLLLRILSLHNKKYKFTRYAADEAYSNEVKSLCIDHFRIEFVNHNISNFVNRLFQELERQEKKDGLELQRQPSHEEENISQRMISLFIAKL